MSEERAARPAPDADALTAEQVADYLRRHPEFFLGQDDLLADLRLPHASGKAISLLERQVAILRDRGVDARQKLNSLLDNARTNDQLFETTRDLVLALLRARDAREVLQVAQDRLASVDSVDACEILLDRGQSLAATDGVRSVPTDELQTHCAEVLRLRRTHCGRLSPAQLSWLFPTGASIQSTALCPLLHDGQPVGVLALGNREADYFNIHLDTLFLDFIGNVIGAVLGRALGAAR